MKLRADINEVLNLLHDFKPEAIQDLENSFPAHRKLIEGGVILGDEEKSELEVRAEICKVGLEFIRKKSEELVPLLRKRLSRLNYIQLFSNGTSLLGGATILALLQENNDLLKYIFASLIFIGALAGLVVQAFSERSLLKTNSMTVVYDSLIDNKVMAEFYLRELDIQLKFKTEESVSRIYEFMNKANELSLKTRAIIEKFSMT